MADREDTAALYKKEIKFPASIGDWTAYRPEKVAAKKIKPLTYGFHRISKDELEKTLKVHYFFAFEFSMHIKEALKASTDIFSISIEQLSYLEFLKRVTGGLIYNKLPIKEIGEVMFLVDYQLANLVINFSLGCQSVDTKTKELTELEESMIHSIFSNVLNKYTSCWKNTFETPNMEIVSYPNIQRESHVNLNEVITVVTTQLSIANSAPSTFTFVYQNSTLKKLNELLSKKEEEVGLDFSTLTDELLASIEVPIVAELGTTDIAAKELTAIEMEDVISLDQKLNDPIKLVLGCTSELKAQPGIKNDHFSVKVSGGSVKKIKTPPKVMLEPATSKTIENEEDAELPLEVEEKEEYNEGAEGLFEEENETLEPENEAGGN
ncbi:MAG: FliM/FliN family flagellar motor switch protein [bacterium]